MKRIGIIGSGNMGRTIGLSLANKGYEVFFGARKIDEAKYASSFDKTTLFGTNQKAAEFGDIIYYSPRDFNPNEVLDDISSLDGKIVIDSSNWNLTADLDTEKFTISKAEVLQSQIPNTKVVKAFNTVLQEIFEYSFLNLKELNVPCFISSDFDDAKKIVSTLVNDLGFVSVDYGSLKQALLLEYFGNFTRVLVRLQASPWTALSITQLDKISDLKMGGRTPSALHTNASFLKQS